MIFLNSTCVLNLIMGCFYLLNTMCCPHQLIFILYVKSCLVIDILVMCMQWVIVFSCMRVVVWREVFYWAWVIYVNIYLASCVFHTYGGLQPASVVNFYFTRTHIQLCVRFLFLLFYGKIFSRPSPIVCFKTFLH